MIIGIVSDTHGWFHPNLAHYFEGVDLILHAGDIGSMDVLVALEALAPVKAVYGNVDGWDIRAEAPEHQEIEVDGLTFMMTHIAGHPARWQRGMGHELRKKRPDVFVCGHSHILQIERVATLGNMLFVNPGAAGRQGFHQVKTCVRIHTRQGALRQAEVIHLDEGIGANDKNP